MIEPIWSVDCRDLPPPYPLLGARAALALMREGEVLGLLVTDDESVLDLPAWCRMTGHHLLDCRERAGVRCLLIRKAIARATSTR